VRPHPTNLTGTRSPGPVGELDGPAVGNGPAARRWPAFDRADLDRARAGDPEALGRFFDHYFDRVFSVACRFTGSVEHGRDLTQEIFFKIRRHLGRLDLERDPAPWLYTVTVHACLDARRSSWWRMGRRSVPLDRAGGAPALASRGPGPEENLLAAEDERRVQRAIGLLPGDLRVSVILHDFEELGHERIGAILGISHAAARKRHSRALHALARLLREGEGP